MKKRDLSLPRSPSLTLTLTQLGEGKKHTKHTKLNKKSQNHLPFIYKNTLSYFPSLSLTLSSYGGKNLYALDDSMINKHYFNYEGR